MPDRSEDQPESTRPRRWLAWPRHRLSWFVGGVVLLMMTIITIGGARVPLGSERLGYPETENGFRPRVGHFNGGSGFVRLSNCWANEFSHGWPYEWYRRGVVYGNASPVTPAPAGVSAKHWLEYTADDPVSWSALDAWPFRSYVGDFSIGALLLDLAVALTIVVLAAALCEAWLRWRGSWTRFRVADLLALTLVVAGPLAWWAGQRSLAKRERATLRDLACDQHNGWRLSYCGPEWLARLVGGDGCHPLGFCYRVTQVSIKANDPDTARLARLRELPWLEEVSFTGQHGPLHRVGAARLTNAEDLVRVLAEIEHPKTIDFAGVMCLREEIDAFSALPHVRVIDVSNAALTESDLADFERRYPHIRYRWQPSWQPLSAENVANVRLPAMGVRLEPSRHGYRIDASGVPSADLLFDELRSLGGKIVSLRLGSDHEVQSLARFLATCGDIEPVTLQQGELSSRDLHSILQAVIDSGVSMSFDLFNARLSPEEVRQIEDVLYSQQQLQVWLDAYAGNRVDREEKLLPAVTEEPKRESSADDPFDDPFEGESQRVEKDPFGF